MSTDDVFTTNNSGASASASASVGGGGSGSGSGGGGGGFFRRQATFHGAGGTTTTSYATPVTPVMPVTPPPASNRGLGEDDFGSVYAYCFDRGDGQYTRLIPADMLPPLVGIPALQRGCAGMIVVKQPPACAPNGRSSNSEPVEMRVRSRRGPWDKSHVSY